MKKVVTLIALVLVIALVCGCADRGSVKEKERGNETEASVEEAPEVIRREARYTEDNWTELTPVPVHEEDYLNVTHRLRVGINVTNLEGVGTSFSIGVSVYWGVRNSTPILAGARPVYIGPGNTYHAGYAVLCGYSVYAGVPGETGPDPEYWIVVNVSSDLVRVSAE